MNKVKVCPKCNRSLPLSDFYKYKKGKYSHSCYCRKCSKEVHRMWRQNNPKYYIDQAKEWRKNNRGRNRESHTQWRRELHIKVLNYISDGIPHCALCGFSDVRILQIDHIDGGGAQEKKRIGGNLSTIFSKILKMKREDAKNRYQILCPNCNWIKKIMNKNERGGLKPYMF